MIEWLKRIFGGKYKKLYDDLKLEYETMLHRIKREVQEYKKEKEVIYTVLENYDQQDREYMRKLAVIQESKELQFMLFDLKQKYINAMLEGDIGGNLQIDKAFGVIKGIDMIMKNLNGYKDAWEAVVKRENTNVEI
jgi:hypothetical protein